MIQQSHFLKLYIHDGILFSHKKEGNSAICDNMDKPEGHYAFHYMK